MGRRFAPILLAATLCGSLVGCSPVLAQDDADDEPDQSRKSPLPRSGRTRPFHFSERQIDRWIFGLDGDVDSARLLSESRLKSTDRLHRSTPPLTPDQRKKLELAGRGDIKRFFDQVTEKKKAVSSSRQTPR